MKVGLLVATPKGDSSDTDIVYRDCVVKVRDRGLSTNLVLLDIYDFDIILSMDWLTAYHALVVSNLINIILKMSLIIFLIKYLIFIPESTLVGEKLGTLYTVGVFILNGLNFIKLIPRGLSLQV